jgi:hypothetical protein
MDNVHVTDADKFEWINFEFLMDPDKPASKYSRQFAIFKDGCPEECIQWVMAFREIKNLMPMKKPAVCMDLLGPFTIKTSAKTHSLLAITIIDPATGWFEIVEATNKSATSIQDLFHNTWLACYPQPQFIVIYNWTMGEFKREFNEMCRQVNYDIKANPTTSHNPQANAIIERLHKIVNDMLI